MKAKTGTGKKLSGAAKNPVLKSAVKKTKMASAKLAGNHNETVAAEKKAPPAKKGTLKPPKKGSAVTSLKIARNHNERLYRIA